MEDNKDLNRIKVMLAEKKRTNKWLAEQLGVNAATVSKWCTNSSQPSLDMLSKIADALNVDYTELVRIKRNLGEEKQNNNLRQDLQYSKRDNKRDKSQLRERPTLESGC